MSDQDQAYASLEAAVFIQGAKDLTFLYKKAERIRRRKGRDWQEELARVAHSIRHLEQWFRDTLPQWMDIDPEAVIEQCKVKAAQSASK